MTEKQKTLVDFGTPIFMYNTGKAMISLLYNPPGDGVAGGITFAIGIAQEGQEDKKPQDIVRDVHLMTLDFAQVALISKILNHMVDINFDTVMTTIATARLKEAINKTTENIDDMMVE